MNTDFCLQIFVHKFLFTIVFFGKKEKNAHETFHILKMEAHSQTHFENENMFLEKWKVINPFLKKPAIRVYE